MFCPNCGKQIPENTKFCSHCGAQQTASNNINSAPSQQNPTIQPPQPQQQFQSQQQFQPQQAQNPPKSKKTGVAVIASVAVVVAAFVLGKFVIAPGMVSDPGKDKDSIGSSSSYSQQGANTDDADNTKGDTTNSAYEAIFEGTFIVHHPMFFNMETASFAMKDADGTIYCVDYGYKDDIVLERVTTTYIPISGYTDAQKSELERKAKADNSSYEALNCCTIKYNMSANYFSITTTFSDLDNTDARNELVTAGIMPNNNPISMSLSEQEVIADGGVKK